MVKKVGREIEKFVPLALLLLVWFLVTNRESYTDVVFPKLTSVGSVFWDKLTDFSLIKEIGISLRRVLIGYFLAALSGVSIGIIVGLSDRMYIFLDLFIQILKPIPPIAWIPLTILWMGIGEPSKIFLIFLGGFFTILLNTIDGIRYIDKKLLEVATALETPKLKRLFKLIIPAALPSIFTGLRVAMGTCWTCVVAAELVASSSGIGYMISNARNFGQIDVVIVGMLSIGIVGKLMDVLLKLVEKKVLRWP